MCFLGKPHSISYDVLTNVANEDFGSVGRRPMVGWSPDPPDKVPSSSCRSSSNNWTNLNGGTCVSKRETDLCSETILAVGHRKVMVRSALCHQSVEMLTGKGSFRSWRVGDGTHSGETERRDGGPCRPRMRRHSPKLEYQQMAAIVYVSSSPTWFFFHDLWLTQRWVRTYLGPKQSHSFPASNLCRNFWD